MTQKTKTDPSCCQCGRGDGHPDRPLNGVDLFDCGEHGVVCGHCLADESIDSKTEIKKIDLNKAAEAQPRPIDPTLEDLWDALVDMTWQFAIHGKKDGVDVIHSGGLSSLELAFEVLGIPDPCPVDRAKKAFDRKAAMEEAAWGTEHEREPEAECVKCGATLSLIPECPHCPDCVPDCQTCERWGCKDNQNDPGEDT